MTAYVRDLDLPSNVAGSVHPDPSFIVGMMALVKLEKRVYVVTGWVSLFTRCSFKAWTGIALTLLSNVVV